MNSIRASRGTASATCAVTPTACSASTSPHASGDEEGPGQGGHGPHAQRATSDGINDVETARKRLDKVSARILYAERGYSGFFDAIKVDEDGPWLACTSST
jgi:Spy/CpxP family protein refolding chaperone